MNLDENVFYPEAPLFTDRQAEEELDRGRVYRLNDRFFKFLFGGEDRKHLFLDLVNALVFPDGSAGFTGFEYANRELSATREGGKSAYFDIVAKMADGTQVEVEVQVRNRGDYLQRSIFYLSNLHASQLKSGEQYQNVKQTISIHILAFSLFDGERFRRVFSLCDEETGERLSDDLRLVYIEAPKYVKHGVPCNRLEYWLLYLAGMEARKMPELMVQDPMIGEALSLEKLFLQSEEERLNYLLSYKAMWDDLTIDEAIHRTARAEGLAEGREEGRAEGREEGRAEGREEGRAEGREEGRAEGREEGRAEGREEGRAEGRAEGEAKGRAETARNLLRMGLEPAKVAEAASLTIEEVNALRGQAGPTQ